jgi:uroporphyrinogen III methyltransferase/synthase
MTGKVYLVGAGPGDPKLLTLRAAELLSRADVIVTDRLANPRLLKLARPDAEIVYAGKASRDHALSQDEIVRAIIEKAKQGRIVVRLKGGDPFVFGRGGEEAEALRAAGIDFEIVPGISSAIAAPAYAGIPVTHRGLAASLGIITGHEAPGKPDPSTSSGRIKWDKIATGLDTLVFLMGVERLPEVVKALISNGRPPDTPAALVEWGTHPTQRTVVGTLADIVDKVRQAGLTAPAVAIVGEVVRLREVISWFERKPLFGKRVIVTRPAMLRDKRPEAYPEGLAEQLEELGAAVDEFPVIKLVAPPDYAPLDNAISELGSFDWIIFTSANGVEWFIKRLEELGSDIRALGNAKLGAIGPKTAAALQDLRLKVHYVPSEYVSEAVVRQFPEDANGSRILIPRALQAREELPEGLCARGADVTVAAAYMTVTDNSHADALRERLREPLDIITFTSASTVNSFFEIIGDTRLPENVVAACIGPITAEAARSHGLRSIVTASEYTIEGLVDVLSCHSEQREESHSHRHSEQREESHSPCHSEQREESHSHCHSEQREESQ